MAAMTPALPFAVFAVMALTTFAIGVLTGAAGLYEYLQTRVQR